MTYKLCLLKLAKFFKEKFFVFFIFILDETHLNNKKAILKENSKEKFFFTPREK